MAKNKKISAWEDIKRGNGEKYTFGGTLGSKGTKTNIGDILALREEERRRQQEELDRRSVGEWKSLLDESDTNLKASQQALANKLFENNLKFNDMNGTIAGKQVYGTHNFSNDLQVGVKPSFNKNKLQENAQNQVALIDYMHTDEAKKLKQDISEKWDERAYNISGYETKKAKEDSKNTGVLTKIATAPIRGGASIFSSLRGDLTTEDGRLTSYNEAIMNEDRENLDNPLLKFGYNALGEIGKQTVVQALNSVGIPIGTAAYFGDIAEDQYNSAILQGYSDQEARNYALLSTGAEAIFERLLGAGSNYFAKKTKLGNVVGQKEGFEKVVSNVLSKYTKIKNKTVNDLMSSFISEGTEEFLEEYLGEFNRQLTLEDEIDLNKVFTEEGRLGQAFESFLIGGITGAYGAGAQAISTPKDIKNVNQAIYTLNQQGKNVSKQNENFLRTMSYIAEETGAKIKPQDLLETLEIYRNSQVNDFKNNAIEQYSNLDENSRILFNNMIQDLSEVIYNTGVNIKFDKNQQELTNWVGDTLVMNPSLTDTPIKTVLLKELSTKLMDNSTKKYILSYMKKNGLYDTLKQELLDSGEYDEANVDNEIISRELNSIFEDQNKLEQLTKEDKNFIDTLKGTVNNIISTVGNRKTKDGAFLRNLGQKLNYVDIKNNNVVMKDLKKEKVKKVDKKQEQYNIIKKSNPATDDYHTWIRSKKDISTFNEALKQAKRDAKADGFEEYSSYPDITNEILEQAQKTGKITVYSSKPIKDGNFVTPSYQNAKDYAGDGKVYSKKVNVDDVAWIDIEQGQYAKVKQVEEQPKVKTKKMYKSTEQMPGNVKKGTYIEPTTPINEKSKKGENYIKEITGERKVSKELSKNYTKLVDKLHPIQVLADVSGNKQLYAKFNNIGMSNGMAQYQIGTAQTDINGIENGKSLNAIWKPVEDANLVNEFNDYLAHRLNVERYSKVPVWDKEVTPEISKKAIKQYEKDHPKFLEWAKDVYKFNDNQLQKMIDSGLAKENAREWLYSNYVTIARDLGPKTNPLTQGNQSIKTNTPIRHAKGGTQAILPMKDSMARQTILTEKAVASNIAGQELLNVLGGTVGEHSSMKALSNEGENNALIQNPDGTYSYTVYKNGVPVTMQITKEIAEAIRPTQISEWEDILPLKAVRGLSKLQRALLTDKNPLFIFTNFFKDIGDAPLNSKYSGGEFFATYPRAITEMLSNSDLWKQYVAKGGKENTYFDTQKGEVKEPKNVLLKGGKEVVDFIENANQFIEQAPRFTEYLLTLDHGGTIDEALYNAAEVTTNFARGGEITKALNRNGFNFLNASVQGFDKQIRNFSKQPGAKAYVRLLTKVAILGVAPALINHMLFGDDDDYKELPDYVKDSYFLFKTGDDHFIRIPKGRVMSVFGTAARHTYEIAKGNEDILSSLQDTGSQIINNVSPNNPLENNIISPFISVKNNRSWNGSPIISTRLQSLPESEQYDEKTSEIAKGIANSWVGKTFKWSPKNIDYLLDQYTGAVGDFVLPMTTPYAESSEDNPLKKLVISPFKSKFTVDSAITSKYSNEFYNTKEALEKDLKTAGSIESSEDTLFKSLQSKYLASVNEDLAGLYAQKREIQNNPDLKDSEKYNQSREIQKKINDLSKFALQDYKDVYISDTYGVVGDKEFNVEYNQGKLTWTKVSDKEKKKQEEYAQKYDMSPEEYYSMDGLTKSTIAGSNIYKYDEINKKLTAIRDNTKEDKKETFNYINSLDLSVPQKAMYIRMYYKSYDEHNKDIINYLDSLGLDFEEKRAILVKLGIEYNKKNNTFYWK